jgi:biopolymer transport protein ExbD
MNFRGEEVSTGDTFQIAPMVDVLFVLMLFFLVNYVTLMNEREINIVLASASREGTQETRASEAAVFINVNERGDVKINGIQECSLNIPDPDKKKANKHRLTAKLKSFRELGTKSVCINADKRTIHQFTIYVMDCCKAANIGNIYFMTTVER